MAQHHLPCQEIPEAGRQEEPKDGSLPGFSRVRVVESSFLPISTFGESQVLVEWERTSSQRADDVQEGGPSLTTITERDRQINANKRINQKKESGEAMELRGLAMEPSANTFCTLGRSTPNSTK